MTLATSSAVAQEYPVGTFQSVFTGKEAFLADHVIQGKKILPGMAYLEIARSAVANSVSMNERFMVVLKDSVFVNALVVGEDSCSLEVKVYPGATGEFGVEVSTEAGIHFQTKAYIQEKTITEPYDLQTFRERCPKEGPDKQQFYRNFLKRQVDLGPSHRGVSKILLGEDCAFTQVLLPGSSQRGMMMDPGMLDSIIQCGISLATDPDANDVPFAVTQTQVFEALVDEMYVFVERAEKGMNYTVTDTNGNVKVIIQGFQTREIDLQTQKDDILLYRPEWNKIQYQEDNQDSILIVDEASSYNNLVEQVFYSTQQLLNDKMESPILRVVLPSDKFEWRGISGALRTLELEHPKIECQLIQDHCQWQTGFQPVDKNDSISFQWESNSTVLLTGGLGGLGKIIAEDIAQQTENAHLILVGRRELSNENREWIEQLTQNGTQVSYEQCDITDAQQVKQLIEEYQQISGVIHASGVLQDNYIAKKTISEIEQVLKPKVTGLTLLDEATSHLPLKYFVAFSSIAGVLGNAGQFDYAAANAYMDAYMLQRQQKVVAGHRYGKSLSVNWPIWDSAGMQIDETTRQNLLRQFKIKPLPAEQGIRALKAALASDETQLVVLYGNKKFANGIFIKPEKQSPQKEEQQSAASDEDSDKLKREMLREVRQQTAEHLKFKPGQLDDYADWADFGFDSILLSSFVNRFNSSFNLNLLPTVLFEATNISLFAQFLIDNHLNQMIKYLQLGSDEKTVRKVVRPVQNVVEKDDKDITSFAQSFRKAYRSNVTYREKDIAVIGMSCRVAGARTLDEFWDMLINERDMISEIPKDRWDYRDYPGTSKWGSFIDGETEFDALFFGISPAEALYMSPEQRLMMEYVWECLENAGCGDEIKGTPTGLFIGTGLSGYKTILDENLPVEAYSATGMVPSVGPNRISYMMDWTGPSNPIDTACSSALVAVHRAVEAIRAGHCEQAIAGGVNLILTPDVYVSFSKSGMLCEDGRCKTFSNKANGYVRGEGVGMLMLKPLKTALRDGNVIHALVKGTSENHGGRTNSLTAPNPKSQAAVIKRAIQDAEIDFGRMGYIECHGTGTELGDPVEIEGLKTVAKELLGARQSEHRCRIGSVKSNIGHLEYGAGAVGLIKAILQIQNKKIARSLHCDTLSPYVNLDGTPFEVAQQSSDWEVETGQTRIAGVSSFGFGGVNSHIVLEEFLDTRESDTEMTEFQPQLLVLSTKTDEALIQYVEKFSEFLKNAPNNPETFQRMAFTLQAGRSEMPERLAFVASSMDEWMEQIETFLEDNGKSFSRGVFRGSVNNHQLHNIEVGDTKAGREFMRQLIESGELEKLAELWVKGSKVDWNALYQ